MTRDLLFPMLTARAPEKVYGLDSESHALLRQCFEQWARCFPRNVERQLYLDMKNGLKDLAVALPPTLVDKLGVVSGWAPKAVYEVSNRVVFKGVHDDPFGLGDLLHENRFEIEFPQAVVSALSQSVAFVSATRGDTSAGEPEVLFQFHSALWSTGVWDRRLRRLRAGLLVNDIDDLGRPTRMTLFVPGEAVSIVQGPGGWYVEDVHRNPPLRHRIPMEPLPYRPTLERPFGRSRIDRTVMSLIDRFVRSGSRLDVHAELFSAVKLILLGATKSTFEQDGKPVPLWQWTMSRLNAIEKDEDGDVPKLEQVSAQSPEPILAYNRQLAAEFSGHTGVPLGSLGIATDNPESQGAKQEARQDIVADVESQHVVFGAALERAFESALMIKNDTAEAPDLRELKLADSSSWRSPQRPTLQAQGDYGAKVVSVAPDLMQTRVGYELLGLEPGQIDRHEAELRRLRAASLVERLAGGTPLPPERGAADVEEV